jgi:uncharacterized membrane protein YdjX (TVP38/TMEM64 family)
VTNDDPRRPEPHRLRGILALVAIVLATAAGAWALRLLAPAIFSDRESLVAFLQRQGTRAPLALMGLQVGQVLLAPIPGHLLALVSGAVFGPWRGTLYTVVGVGLGSALAMALARLAGRPLVERLAPRGAMANVDRWATRRGPVFFFLFFMLPFTPDDLACFALGLSSLPMLPMLGLSVVARLPGHFASAWIGATATRLSWALWIAIAALAGLIFAFGWRHRQVIEAWMLARIERVEDTGAGRAVDPVPGSHGDHGGDHAHDG